nr:MAG TPA: hypothetical protein [Caudoviricetes sp.]
MLSFYTFSVTSVVKSSEIRYNLIMKTSWG